MVPTTVAEELPDDLAKDPEFKSLDLTEKVLKASRQKGVLGVQIYLADGKADPNGKFDPKGILEANDDGLSDQELEKLRRFETVSSFKHNVLIRKATSDREELRDSLLRALVPLRQGELFIGAAEFFFGWK